MHRAPSRIPLPSWYYPFSHIHVLSVLCCVPAMCPCVLLLSGWGDYVVLTGDHRAFGAAANGPLQEGQLGVVVGVDHLSDSSGGLKLQRYVVRACHNEVLHRCVVVCVVANKPSEHASKDQARENEHNRGSSLDRDELQKTTGGGGGHAGGCLLSCCGQPTS